ncbi:hypothetical protein THF5H11_60149 [Vibrio jasicida]|nr:hypothetical protein THF5H11_60149 [Vibrio jasicida]
MVCKLRVINNENLEGNDDENTITDFNGGQLTEAFLAGSTRDTLVTVETARRRTD